MPEKRSALSGCSQSAPNISTIVVLPLCLLLQGVHARTCALLRLESRAEVIEELMSVRGSRSAGLISTGAAAAAEEAPAPVPLVVLLTGPLVPFPARTCLVGMTWHRKEEALSSSACEYGDRQRCLHTWVGPG